MYDIFCKEYKVLCPLGSLSTFSYFTQVWNAEVSWVKVRKLTRFPKCGTCEPLSAAIQEAITNGLPTDDLTAEKDAHV